MICYVALASARVWCAPMLVAALGALAAPSRQGALDRHIVANNTVHVATCSVFARRGKTVRAAIAPESWSADLPGGKPERRGADASAEPGNR